MEVKCLLKRLLISVRINFQNNFFNQIEQN